MHRGRERFLAMVGWMTALSGAGQDVHITPLPVPNAGKVGFQLLSSKPTGLTPKRKHTPNNNIPIRETGHSGLAVGDVNGDGLPDLFVCGMETANALYLNQGNWKFKDVAEESGVACSGWRLSGAVFADVDGDHDMDLVLTSLMDGRNFMFLNDGKGRFTENLRVKWVYNPRGGSVSVDLADVDGDGDLDMYATGSVRVYMVQELGSEQVLKIRRKGIEDLEAHRTPSAKFFEYYGIYPDESGLPNVRPTYIEDHLYLNDGQGGFNPVSDLDERFMDYQGQRMKRPRDPSHEALFRDVDDDGDPDLYVTSDFSNPDRLWINDGRGRFKQSHPLTIRRTSYFSMGFDYSDINRDGHLDFLTTDMLSRSHKLRKTQMGNMPTTESTIGQFVNRTQIMQNTLQLNRGDGTWAEIAQLAGVHASEWSWGVAFTDVDLDGYEDLIVATGMTRDFMDADTTAHFGNRAEAPRENFPKLATQNALFRNQGDLTFKYVSDDWGFIEKAVSGGLIQADFDGDGDLDLIFNNWKTPLEIYRNETTAPRIAVKLLGRGTNTQAIGTKVRLLGGPGGSAPMEHEVHVGGGYASGSESLVVFGSGEKREGLSLEIIWRHKGTLHRTLIQDVKPNHMYTVTEPEEFEPYVKAKPEPLAPLFADADDMIQLPDPQVSGQMAHKVHHESVFDDFAYQSLLPNRFSQLGPGVAWADLNGNGREDLIVGSGGGGKLVVHLGSENGKPFEGKLGPGTPLDLTSVIVWTLKPGTTLLTAGQSSYENPGKQFEQPAAAISYPFGHNLSRRQLIPGHNSATGPMTVADVDGDGDLDLFVGGRTIPARYPEPASSRLFLNENGMLKLDADNAKAFEKLGLISGAVFGDLDEDGDPDLVLACEWGPVKVLHNHNGKFEDATEALELDAYKGWWNSVTLGDFDADGRLDIAAGNWGRNSKYENSYNHKEPLRIAYRDFDQNGVLDIVEYHRDKLTGKLVPERGRSCSMNAMPFIGERNKTFAAFGSGTIEEVYGASLKQGIVIEANTLTHTVFLNRDGKFEAQPLPIEAQFAPVFGINVADFDGDGQEDLFVAQNFFASQIETPRSDGGRGLLLRGNGKGGFMPISGHVSGIFIWGEQRGSAVGDYNQDGRPDLAVAQNGATTRLFRNMKGQPGLRVRFNAGPANPTGVGAIARMKFKNDKKGPAKIVTAGSGYWSQDSPVQIYASSNRPLEIEVQWPYGKTTRTPIPTGSNEIEVNQKGELKQIK